jgi:hypothetical protein
MSHKKPAEEPKSEEQQLVERVDAMMDIKRPDNTPIPAAPAPSSEPIDIFKDMHTQPPVETVTEKPEVVEQTDEGPEPASNATEPQQPTESHTVGTAPPLSPQAVYEPEDEPDVVPVTETEAEEVPQKQDETEAEPESEKSEAPTAPDVPETPVISQPAPQPFLPKPISPPALKPSSVPIKVSILDDSATDKAVEEIMVAESDQLLAADDMFAKNSANVKSPKKGKFGKLFK